MVVLLRIICLILGYGFGLLQTGVIYSKLAGVDIREHGSGKSGTTNALRVLGFKAGLVVFIGDFCKSFVPCMIARFVFRGTYPDTYYIYMIYLGFGAVLGHIFPFYLGFKGGKGIATIGGFAASIFHPVVTVIALVIFIGTIAITKYMSVGSIVLMVCISAGFIIETLLGLTCFNVGDPYSRGVFIEGAIMITLLAALAIFKHKANIIRLKNHEENKFTFKKKENV